MVLSMRFVAIGDSQSEGIGDLPWPDGRLRGWADRLALHLCQSCPEAHYANLAVRGKCANAILAEQLGPALTLEPDLVTVTAGVSDVLRPGADLAAIVETIDQLVAGLRTATATVLVVACPELASLHLPGRLLSKRVAAFNNALTTIAEAHGALAATAPAASVFEDLRAWSPDRLHLSALGHQRLASAAANLLGLPGHTGWATPPDNNPPRRTVATEYRWARKHLAPWAGKRLRGISSADGQVAKMPDLHNCSLIAMSEQS